MSDFVLDEFLPYQLAVLASRVSHQFAQLYSEHFGITIPEWRVVAHLSQSEKVSVRDVHLRVDMDKSKVSRAASRLEAAGYVTKIINLADRRLVELSLTPKGRQMFEELTPIAQKFEQEVLAQLGDKAETFQTSLRELLSEKPKTT